MGATGLWACDHLFWQGPSLECLTALAVAATATEGATVGSCVLQLPLRSVPATAKAVASLQELSGGRFVLGVGVGTHPGEYEAAGSDYRNRGVALDAALGEMSRLWQCDTAAGDEVVRYRQRPEPLPVPVWVGGSSPAAMHRAALHDGWLPMFLSPEDYGVALAAVRRQADSVGRDPTALHAGLVAFVSLGNDSADAGLDWMSSLYGLPGRAFARHLLAGDAASVASQLGRWVVHGAEHVVVFVTDDEPASQFEDLAGEFTLRFANARSSEPARMRPSAGGARS